MTGFSGMGGGGGGKVVPTLREADTLLKGILGSLREIDRLSANISRRDVTGGSGSGRRVAGPRNTRGNGMPEASFGGQSSDVHSVNSGKGSGDGGTREPQQQQQSRFGMARVAFAGAAASAVIQSTLSRVGQDVTGDLLMNQMSMGSANGWSKAKQAAMFTSTANMQRDGYFDTADRLKGLNVGRYAGMGSPDTESGANYIRDVSRVATATGQSSEASFTMASKFSDPMALNMLNARGIKTRAPNGDLLGPQGIIKGVMASMTGGRTTSTEDIRKGFQQGQGLDTAFKGLGFSREEIMDFVQPLALGDKDPKKYGGKAGSVMRSYQGRAAKEGDLAASEHNATLQGIKAANEVAGDLASSFKNLMRAVEPLSSVLQGMGGAGGALAGVGPGGGGGGGIAGALGSQAMGLGMNAGMMGLMARGMGKTGPGGAPLGAAARMGGAAKKGGMAAAGLMIGLGGIKAADWLNRKFRDHGNKWYDHLANVGSNLSSTMLKGVAGGLGGALATKSPWGAGAGAAAAVGEGIYDNAHVGYAEGGVIPGGHTRDDVPILATPGEVVVPRSVVARHGGAEALMEGLGFSGQGGGGHYAKGGIVTASAGGKKFQVAASAKEKFEGFVNALVGMGYHPSSIGGFNDRNIAGTNKKSNHAYGLAIDIDPSRNPRYADAKGGRYALPTGMSALAHRFGLNWGGDYHSSKDYMHFEDMNGPASGGGRSRRDSGDKNTGGGGHSPDPVGDGSGSTGVMSATWRLFADGAFQNLASAGGSSLGLAGKVLGGGGVSGLTHNILGSLGDAASAVAGLVHSAGSAISGLFHGGKKTSGNRGRGQQLAKGYGWGSGSQWGALDALWNKESGWNNAAQNPHSTAYGIAQFLDSTWSGSGTKKTSDADAQIQAGLKYIKGRYKDPQHAWEFHKKHNYYSMGAWSTKTEQANLHQGEMVLPARIADAVRGELSKGGKNTGTSRSGGGNSVTIHVHAARADSAEAKRLAEMVKGYLEDDKHMSAIGSL